MARRIRRVGDAPKKIVTFKVSEDFFNTIDSERKKFFKRTGIMLTQPVMSNLILKEVKFDFLNEDIFGSLFNGTKKRTKKK